MIGKLVIALCLVTLLLSAHTATEQEEKVEWISFEQLEDSLEGRPKKVFIDFYTDWCTYCRKMDKVVFTKPEVIALLNEDYYAIRFDAETTAEVTFGGQKLINDQVGESRNPLHQIAQLLALRNGQFTPPAMVVLDKDFKVKARYFEYMDSKKLIDVLK